MNAIGISKGGSVAAGDGSGLKLAVVDNPTVAWRPTLAGGDRRRTAGSRTAGRGPRSDARSGSGPGSRSDAHSRSRSRSDDGSDA